MRKQLMAISLASVMALSLAGCGGGEHNSDNGSCFR